MCWSDLLNRGGLPVRSFPSYRGQRNCSGWWWLSHTGTHVGYESWLERDNLMVLDADPDVVSVVSQPFWLHWFDADRPKRHAPDFLVRHRDGTVAVIDVRADDRVEVDDVAVFAMTGRACESVGWGYRRVGTVDPVLAANLRWLSGYRHPRNRSDSAAANLMAAFRCGRPLLEGCCEVGDPIEVLPTLFHLLWTGSLVVDLLTLPLDAWTSVRSGP
ncbi:TnsA-like heteromeric transposase endonuclease subunit [Nocardia ninae]|nr:TnsA-like heteromeric transposase endonuclease subunit [Nocardia ninae]